jgi:hypothetical protein
VCLVCSSARHRGRAKHVQADVGESASSVSGWRCSPRELSCHPLSSETKQNPWPPAGERWKEKSTRERRWLMQLGNIEPAVQSPAPAGARVRASGIGGTPGESGGQGELAR